jgi:hypothetical protein
MTKMQKFLFAVFVFLPCIVLAGIPCGMVLEAIEIALGQ